MSFINRESTVVESGIERMAREEALRPAVAANKGLHYQWTLGSIVVALGFFSVKY